LSAWRRTDDPLNTVGSANFSPQFDEQETTHLCTKALPRIRTPARASDAGSHRTLTQFFCTGPSFSAGNSALAYCLLKYPLIAPSYPRSHLERLQRKERSQSLPHVSLPILPRTEEDFVVRWIGEDGDAFVIVGCSGEECHPTNIDFLDCVC